MRDGKYILLILLGGTLIFAQGCEKKPKKNPKRAAKTSVIQDVIEENVDPEKQASQPLPSKAPAANPSPTPSQGLTSSPQPALGDNIPPPIGPPAGLIPGNGPGFGGGSQGFLEPIDPDDSEDSDDSDEDNDEPCEDCDDDEDCDNGIDDDSDGLVDCRDPDCFNQTCNDNNICTTNDVCTRDLVCQGTAVVCNDDNPCTNDACANSGCVYTNNTDLNAPGDCETDGNPCTIGKCTPSNPQNPNSTFTCFEENRAFFSGEIGCMDSNQCTADSCVVTCENGDEPRISASGGSPCNSTTTRDLSDNVVITDSGWQCVNEVMENIVCFVENECTPGICTITGTGMPGTPFATTCEALPAASPLAQCPDTDSGNDCIENACVVGQGCVQLNVAAGTTCSTNFNPCTTNVCDGMGNCNGPNVTDGTTCDDFNDCTTGDRCLTGACTGTGTEADGTVCGGFFDTCDLLTCLDGQCGAIVPNTTICDDSNSCTVDTCDLFTGCAHEAFADNTPAGGPCLIPGQLGICAEGALVCIGGQVTTQCADLEIMPSTEVCNGLDDNCDGVVDNLLTGQCPKFVFVTSEIFTGSSLGGIMGADALCQTAAGANPALVGKTFRAWISDEKGYEPLTSPYFKASGPYKLVNGTTVVNTGTGLFLSLTTPLLHAINLDESGMSPIRFDAWTGTNADGTVSTGNTCNSWTAGPFSGQFGLLSATGTAWTSTGITNCPDFSFGLYCFEQ